MPSHVVRKLRFLIAMLLALTLLAGCGSDETVTRNPVDVRADDTCAVCGMYLGDSPGPRAQAWVAGRAQPLIFDSTRDFFAYVLQPENQDGLRQLYVQDSARIDWQHPTGAAASFIDARKAAYVLWQPLPGAMGPTLAPFVNRADANAFVHEHGGSVLGYAAITPALVANLDYRCPAGAKDAAGPAQCLAAPVNAIGAALNEAAAANSGSAPAQH